MCGKTGMTWVSATVSPWFSLKCLSFSNLDILNVLLVYMYHHLISRVKVARIRACRRMPN